MKRPTLTPLALILTTTLTACVATNPSTEKNPVSTDVSSKAAPTSNVKCQPRETPAPVASKESKAGKSSNTKDAAKKKAAAPIPEAADSMDCLPFPSNPANKMVPARELLTELRGLRTGFASPNPMKSMDSMFAQPVQALTGTAMAKNGAAPASPPAQANPLGGLNFGSAGSLLTDVVLDSLISELSYSAIDQLFGQMTDDKDILRRVAVEVPDTSKLAPPIRKQVLSMAAYLAAIKASGVMIDASLKDFEAAKSSYLKAIEIRRMAVEVMGEALTAHAGLEASVAEGKKRGTNYITDPAEKALLESFHGRSKEELLNDFEAQNLALNYAKTKRPELYKNYSMEVQQVKTHYGAYARTMVGAGSMLGFTSLFLKKAKTMFEQQGQASLLILQPLLMQALQEAISLAPRVKNTFDGGDDMIDGSFKIRIEGQEKPLKSRLTAKKALDALDNETQAQYKDTLINPKGNGLVYALYKRNPKQAGALLDHLSSKDTRSAISKHYLQRAEASDFNFQNAFDGKFPLSKAEKNDLTANLLNTLIESKTADEGDKALIKAQEEVRGNLSKYNNADLRKLIFSAPNQSRIAPGINLGKTTIQIDALGISGMAEHDEIVGGSLAQATIRSYKKGAGAARSDSAEGFGTQVLSAAISAAATRQSGKNSPAPDAVEDQGHGRGHAYGHDIGHGNKGKKKHDD